MTRTPDGRPWAAVLVCCVLTFVLSAAWLVQVRADDGTAASPVSAPPPAATPTPSAGASAEASAASASDRPSSRKARSRPAKKKPAPVAEPIGVPQTLLVRRLGVEVPVRSTTVDRDGQMELPDRPREIGWYAYGPRPGADRGSAVLAGHVDSAEYGIGPLVRLSRARRGDEIVVLTDRGRQEFVVTEVEMIRKRALPVEELFRRSGPGVLRIVTCGGPYRQKYGGYRDNVIVSGVPR